MLPPGTLLGGCRILAEVGRGGMGVVYRAEDLRIGRPVALEVIRPELAEDQVLLRRLELEARAAGRVSHPRVTTIYGVGREHGLVFLAFEWAPD